MANRIKQKDIPENTAEAEITAQEANLVSNTSEKKKTSKPPKRKEKNIWEEERISRIIGLLIIVLSVASFIAFCSFLFTWREDQQYIRDLGWGVFFNNEQQAKNYVGWFGSYISYYLIWQGFGIASFLFCSFFFTVGANFLFHKPLFSISRQLRYLIFGLFYTSILLSFLIPNSETPYDGMIGDTICYSILIKWFGSIGTGLLLLLTALSFLIWKTNPTISHISFINFFHKIFYKEQEPPTNDSPTNVSSQEDDREEYPADLQNPDKPLAITNMVPQPATTQDTVITADIANNRAKTTTAQNKPDLQLEIKSPITAPSEESVVITKTVKPTAHYDSTIDLKDYQYPILDLLAFHGGDKVVHDPAELDASKNQIIEVLQNFDIQIQRISATIGPTVTLYEIVPAPGIKIGRIRNLADDIALSLSALGIRIIAPIPGKGTIGIEVPNIRKSIVSMRTLLSSEKFQKSNFSLPIALGKQIDNENFIVDLASMPHLLMAGATGQGKSVGINAVLVSLLYKKHPSQLKLVLVDPKKVELSLYKIIEQHFLAKLPGEEDAIITDTKKVIYTLNALCIEMDNRYGLLQEAGCRIIKEYNEKFIKNELNPDKGHQFLPFIVLVIDEFADLIMTAGKDVETPIGRLAQLARAVGIHLIIATQRPSVNIITGTIKANFPARIAFKVSSKVDSRTIMDAGGAEQLIGKGDMLINYNGELTRLQCAFVDTPEVEKVCEFIAQQEGYPTPFYLPEYIDEKELNDAKDGDDSIVRDALFNDAAKLIVQTQSGSTSLLQRKMKLGYNRAGRLMDQLEQVGIVGHAQGSKPREVKVRSLEDLESKL
ncbi:MAG: DNA translocase FtsK 4TM domain-containing protein [Phycisphaerales bacterium]|nr:DNA translocase FtsK 4TM domain-containing protein [Phycisphaerales bacterium]